MADDYNEERANNHHLLAGMIADQMTNLSALARAKATDEELPFLGSIKGFRIEDIPPKDITLAWDMMSGSPRREIPVW